MTGIAFTHGTVTDLTSPSSMPVHLLEFKKAARSAPANDSALRSAIVGAANYFLRLAEGKTPAEMQALIWQNDSLDGADHGESCAAFASLMLEAGAQATGQQSWVSGGTSYPWPVHGWVDARVDPNPASPGIVSLLQDAEAHHRWHPLGDGYAPRPGDWVLFDGHVEVVTKYAGGVLYTIGGDSMPNLSVNAHQYEGPLAAQGVTGFVNNGEVLSDVSHPATAAAADGSATVGSQPQVQADQAKPVIPGVLAPAFTASTAQPASGTPEAPTAGVQADLPAAAAIPGAQAMTGTFTHAWSTPPSPRYSRSQPPPGTTAVPATAAQQAFINEVAAGAVAAQQRYGIPAAVTIAQAIDESGWGQSELAAQDNNLFGIKGTGPAGSVTLPTQEYVNGQWVTTSAPFRVYNNMAESISDHSLLLATGSSYKQAMADRQSPDAFANDLTGVYATDPSYGANLITIMRLYNLYRYDTAATAHGTSAHNGSRQGAAGQSTSRPAATAHGETGQSRTGQGAASQGAASQGAASQGAASQGAASQGAASQGGTGHGAAGRAVTAQGASGRRGSAEGPAGRGAVRQGSAAEGATRSGERGHGAAGPAGNGAASLGAARIPGVLVANAAGPADAPAPGNGSAALGSPSRPEPVMRAGPRNARVSTRRYLAQIPATVTTAFIATAKTPVLRSRPLYQDVASRSGIRWELLAACDWMQCQAQAHYSPVHGEKLGTRSADGTVYRTKSEALDQAASDLIVLASAVYRIDLTRRIHLSIRDLANVFAAYRWGGLLRAHHISAMEFPYSVAGLTPQHLKMRWPDIPASHAPDKPGTRFRGSFGAVPVVLGLDFPALA